MTKPRPVEDRVIGHARGCAQDVDEQLHLLVLHLVNKRVYSRLSRRVSDFVRFSVEDILRND